MLWWLYDRPGEVYSYNFCRVRIILLFPYLSGFGFSLHLCNLGPHDRKGEQVTWESRNQAAFSNLSGTLQGHSPAWWLLSHICLLVCTNPLVEPILQGAWQKTLTPVEESFAPPCPSWRWECDSSPWVIWGNTWRGGSLVVLEKGALEVKSMDKLGSVCQLWLALKNWKIF